MAERKPDNPHANHRARMQERVRKNGLESMAEHEVLEYLLFFAIPRQDTNALAHRLIQHFGSFCRVLEANEAELCKVPGIGPSSARLIVTVREVCGYYTRRRGRMISKPLSTVEDCIEYVTPLFFAKTMEQLYLVAMDDSYMPLREILIAEGLPNQVTFDTRKLAREAVASGCTCILLAHNHPTGMAALSDADLKTTCTIIRALAPLDIQVIDHIIVAPDGAYSVRQHHRLPTYDKYSGKLIY